MALVGATSDDFNDNSLNTGVWSEWAAGDVSETSQTLRITSTTAASYKGTDVSAAAAYNDSFSSSSAHVEVVNALSTSLSTSTSTTTTPPTTTSTSSTSSSTSSTSTSASTSTTILAHGFIPKVTVTRFNNPVIIKRFKLRVK